MFVADVVVSEGDGTGPSGGGVGESVIGEPDRRLTAGGILGELA